MRIQVDEGTEPLNLPGYIPVPNEEELRRMLKQNEIIRLRKALLA